MEQIKKDPFSIFVCATHYEGDPPDNAVEFSKNFVKSEEKFNLSSVKYAIYSLGDLTYKYFGKFGKDVDEALERNGAQRIMPNRIGTDHMSAIEEDFNEWKKDIWPKMIPYLEKLEKIYVIIYILNIC